VVEIRESILWTAEPTCCPVIYYTVHVRADFWTAVSGCCDLVLGPLQSQIDGRMNGRIGVAGSATSSATARRGRAFGAGSGRSVGVALRHWLSPPEGGTPETH
jgi:hypothetical protein